MDIWPTMNI